MKKIIFKFFKSIRVITLIANMVCLSISLFSAPLYADIISPDRRIDWSVAGVEGGIPDRTEIYTTLNAADYGNGVNGASEAINLAINNCPDDQVVYLTSGIFRIDKQVWLRNSSITLRGAGMDKTVLLLDDLKYGLMIGEEHSRHPAVDIISGYDKGSTELVLQNLNNISAGSIVLIDELNDPDFPVSNVGVGTCTWCGRESGNRVRGQLTKVVSMTGNTITIDPPLFFTFSATYLPQAVALAASLPSGMVTEYSGIENLTIKNNWRPSKVKGSDGKEYSAFRNHTSNNDQPVTGVDWDSRWVETGSNGSASQAWQNGFSYSSDYNFMRIPVNVAYAANCWLKGVKVERGGMRCIQLFNNIFRFEIRDSVITKCINRYASNEGYGTLIGTACTGILIENNIYDSVANGPMFAWGASGNVVGYNFMYDCRRQQNSATWFMAVGGSHHGAHTAFILWEGNKMERLGFDDYWGSHSNNTVFRNRIFGKYIVDSVENPNYIQSVVTISTDNDIHYQNYLGNILGTQNYHDFYERNSEVCPNGYLDKLIYRTGYLSSGTCDTTDADVWTTMLRHMNYDYVSNSIKYCDSPSEPGCQGGDASRQLPDSLYLTSKPSWFGNLSWPPIGPDVPGMEGKLPAEIRYNRGKHKTLIPWIILLLTKK